MFRPAKLDRLSRDSLRNSSFLFLLRLQIEEEIRKAISLRTYSHCEIIWDRVWTQIEEEIAGNVANQLRALKLPMNRF